MLSTLARLEGQRDRLALVAPPPVSSTSTSAPRGAQNPYELPPNTDDDGKSKKMTASRKDRRRKVQKLVDRVKVIVDAADFEKDPGADITMDKSDSAAGKVNRFARVRSSFSRPAKRTKRARADVELPPSQTPELLAIHLSRSTHYGYSGAVKNSCQVTFPEYLNLAPFCDGAQPRPRFPSDDSSPPALNDVYRLASLVVHYGSHSFGHYVAFRRRPDSSLDGTSGSDDERASSSALPDWYRVSDETVDPSDIYEALRANPFLVFYERVREDRRTAPRSDEEQLGTGSPAHEALAGGATARVVESWRAAQRRPAPAVPGKEDRRSGRADEASPEPNDGL